MNITDWQVGTEPKQPAAGPLQPSPAESVLSRLLRQNPRIMARICVFRRDTALDPAGARNDSLHRVENSALCCRPLK
jgi:hypothetical protein